MEMCPIVKTYFYIFAFLLRMELPCKVVSSMDLFYLFFRFVELHAVLFKVKRGFKDNAKK